MLKGRLTGESRTAEEIRESTYLFVGEVEAKQTRFWLLLILAAGIATAGIVGDSTATVIGAMIVAPLAVPIQGAAVAISYGELRALLQSLGMVLAAMLVVIGLAAVLSVVLPQLYAPSDNSQITARVSPTIIDLVAALATGLAGAFAVSRRDIADIVPGVAIAISLVPPLAVVGVTASNGDWDSAWGALLLFLTNVLAIILAGIVVFSAARARQGAKRAPGFRARPVYSIVAIASLLVVAALGVATYRTLQLSSWRSAASDVASRWAQDHGEHLAAVRFDGTTLVVFVEGLSSGDDDGELPELLRDAVPAGTPVVVNRVAGRRQPVGDVAG